MMPHIPVAGANRGRGVIIFPPREPIVGDNPHLRPPPLCRAVKGCGALFCLRTVGSVTPPRPKQREKHFHVPAPRRLRNSTPFSGKPTPWWVEFTA
eukprot:1181943-Prorocentrum_minimum.AAC.2